jgi:uncharacterized protein YprB with RNaseH-like and TPR domain
MGKPINPNILKKKEKEIFFTGRCRHRHLYCEHPSCFRKEILEKNGQLVEGYLDIETTGFEANYHHILTYVIKVRGKKKYYTASITKEDLDSGEFDKRVCEQLIKDLSQFDIIYTYYGTGFDIPFMRSRCMYWGLTFPEFGTLQHKDLYYVVRRLFKLNRKSLEVVTRFLGIEGKNHVLGNEWMLARIGNKKGLKYVMEHNIIDCDILEKLHDRLENSFKKTTSTV